MPVRTFRPRTTEAASRKSSILLLVHDPMNTVSTAISRIAVPGFKFMYASARLAVSRAASSVMLSGSGTKPSIETTCPGLVPHET